MSDDQVTLGEVYRKLIDIDGRHGAQLAAIEAQARLTNGRTSRLEEFTGRIDERVHAVESDVKSLKNTRTTGPDNSGDIRIPVNAKTLTAIVMMLAGLVMAYFTMKGGG